MKVSDFYALTKNKVGEIYIARKGTVMIFIIDGTTYMLSCTHNGAVIINPRPDYWIHAIDWAGGFSDYFTHQMCPPDKLTYNAQPIVPIEAGYLDKLKSLVIY
jgi:hypothetical protein